MSPTGHVADNKDLSNLTFRILDTIFSDGTEYSTCTVCTTCRQERE